MSEHPLQEADHRPPPAPVDGDRASMAKVVYILYLVSIVVPVTSIVGVVIAYMYKGQAPAWLRDHYRFQIRTFWIGWLYSVGGWFTTPILIGWLILLFVLVWLVVRCVKGLQWLDRRQPVRDVETWLLP